MKRFIALLVILIAVMMPVGVVFASDISDSDYYGTIRVSNNSTAVTNVATTITGINTTNLIDGGYINATATNCAIQRSGSDVAFMPGIGSNPWLLYEPSIGANTYLNDIFYTQASGGKLAYFPDSSGMTVTDDASTEITDNGTASITAFIDTDNGTDRDIISKNGSVRLYVSPVVTGNITASASGDWTTPVQDNNTDWSNPDNAVDDDTGTLASRTTAGDTWSVYYTVNLTTASGGVRYWWDESGAGYTLSEIDINTETGWETVYSGVIGSSGGWLNRYFAVSEITQARIRFYNDAVGSISIYLYEIDVASGASVSATGISTGEYDIDVMLSANVTTTVTQSSYDNVLYLSSAYSTRAGTRVTSLQEGTITRTGFYLTKVGSPTGNLSATARTVSGDTLLGTIGIIDVSTISVSPTWYYFTASPIANTSSQDVRILVEYTGGNSSSYISMAINNANVLANHQRTTYAGSYTDDNLECTFVYDILSDEFTLTLDGSDTTYYAHSLSIPDVSTNWIIGGDSTLYIESASITVNGATTGSWEWEYDTTFTDLSGNGNDATPTFRTTSSDPDVSAELISFQPVEEADAPAYTITSPTDWVSGNTTVTENFTTAITPTYPGSDIVSDAATAGSTPVQLPTLIIASVFMLGLSYTSTHFLKKYNTLSLAVQLFIITIGLGILVAVHVIDNWMLWLFLMIGTAIAMMSTRIGFAGTGTTGNNLVGFLFMSFAGMTLINRILEGRFLQTADINIINDVLVFQPFSVFGWFTIPVPNVSFLTNGIPAIVRWDYSFFGGDAQIIQYMLYSITAVLSFILFVLALGAAYQMFSRGR